MGTRAADLETASGSTPRHVLDRETRPFSQLLAAGSIEMGPSLSLGCGGIGGADILVCLESASVGVLAPPSGLDRASMKENVNLRNSCKSLIIKAANPKMFLFALYSEGTHFTTRWAVHREEDLTMPGPTRSSHLHDRQRGELLAEHGFAGSVEPGLKDSGVDAAEVGGELEVTLIEVGERGVSADQTRLD